MLSQYEFAKELILTPRMESPPLLLPAFPCNCNCCPGWLRLHAWPDIRTLIIFKHPTPRRGQSGGTGHKNYSTIMKLTQIEHVVVFKHCVPATKLMAHRYFLTSKEVKRTEHGNRVSSQAARQMTCWIPVLSRALLPFPGEDAMAGLEFRGGE